MKIQILEQKKNPLLKRSEVSISLEHPGKATPSRREMLPELAKALKSSEDLLIIDKIFSVPGKTLSRARVLAYNKRDEIPREKAEKMKRRMAEKKPPAEAPEEGKGGEKKGEGGKEEKPAEEAKPEEKKSKEKAPEKEDKG